MSRRTVLTGTAAALSFDAKGIVMLPQDLREDTRRNAEAKQAAGGYTMKTRLAAGEKLGRKRMAVLGAVFDCPAAPRTVDDVIADPDTGVEEHRKRADGPTASNKWLTGSVADTCADVISAAFDQAEARDPDHQRDWIVLTDGAEAQIAQIAQIQAEALVRGIDIHIVCDLIHVLEYLWKAAWCLHDKAGPDIEAFVARHARTILAGNSEQTVADLRHAAKTAALPDDKLATIEKTCTYLENKRPWLVGRLGEDFLAQAFRRRHQIFRQAVTTPQSLLSWRALNTILATQRLDPPRLRLSRDRITLRQEEYSTTVVGRRTVVWHRLATGELHRRLAEGATLVVDAIDEIHPPIGELAASLERRPRTGVTGITNAASEGINRLIKTDSSAFGYRNPANQRLRARCATTRRARGLLTTHTSGRHSQPRRQHG